LTAVNKVPATYVIRDLSKPASYGTGLADVDRQVGVYTGSILKGAKPADLPVQAPTKYELVVNLKVAKAIGLTVPQSILARADEVSNETSAMRH
jgi:putative ABC transport system substrate-binding protein